MHFHDTTSQINLNETEKDGLVKYIQCFPGGDTSYWFSHPAKH